jgi:hypothetical protein
MAYRDADCSVPPLPPRRKTPPPTGWTGHSGAWTERDRIIAWLAKGVREFFRDRETGEYGEYCPAAGNIAWRLPPDLIGIDVDAYNGKAGAKTLARLEKKLGALPPTWMVSNRDDGKSGIRIFKVPKGLHWDGHADGPSCGIEIITWYHRYVVVEPSIHPEGRKYLWYDLQGIACGYEAFLESEEDFASLPGAWVGHITRGRKYIERPAAELSKAETKAELERCPEPGGEPCRGMQGTLDYWLPLIRKAKTDGGAHDAALEASNAVVKDARKGHRGVTTALDTVREEFYAATADPRRADPRRDEAEWGRMVDGAVKKAVLEIPHIRETDTACGLAAALAKHAWSPKSRSDVARRLRAEGWRVRSRRAAR